MRLRPLSAPLLLAGLSVLSCSRETPRHETSTSAARVDAPSVIAAVRRFPSFSRFGKASPRPSIALVAKPAYGAPVRFAREDDRSAFVEVDTGVGLHHDEELHVAVSDVAPQAHLVLGPHGGGVEEAWLLDDARAPTTLTQSLILGPALVSLRVREGRLEALDGAGRVRLGTSPIVVVDAAGARHPVAISVEKESASRYRVTLRLAPESLENAAYPLLVDPLWTTVATMTTRRYGHAAIVLSSGKVMVVGGYSGAAWLTSSEIYDPVLNTWSAGGTLSTRANVPCVVRLPTNEVLIAGGFNDLTGPMKASNLCNAAGTSCSPTDDLGAARYQTPLVVYGGSAFAFGSDGRAEVFGGSGWSFATGAGRPRLAPTATAFSTGVFVAGGTDGTGGAVADAAVFVPTTGFGASVGLAEARTGHSAILLRDDRVLLVGGSTGTASPVYSSGAEAFTPSTAKSDPVAAMTTSRASFNLEMLANGSVIAVGGFTGALVSDTSEIYDPVADAWSAGPSLKTARWGAASARLPDGRILVTGGSFDSTFNPTNTSMVVDDEILEGYLGYACTTDGQCTSGHCVTGVCCDTTCAGSCDSCREASKFTGLDGTCGATSSACSPGDADASDAGSDGAVADTTPDVTLDTAPDVTPPDTTVADTTVADTKPETATDAGPDLGVCGGGPGCPTGLTCVGGSCVLPTNDAGAPSFTAAVTLCDAAHACPSGFCVDGLCCESKCGEACHTCAFPGFQGKCIPQPPGFDLRGDCKATQCQTVCNGAGGCRPSIKGDQCRPAGCVPGSPSTVVSAAAICSGVGVCDSSHIETRSCSPYICALGACLTVCTSSDQCEADFVCDATTQHCVAPAVSDSGGCAVRAVRAVHEGGNDDESGRGAWIALAISGLAWLVGRKRRASGRFAGGA